VKLRHTNQKQTFVSGYLSFVIRCYIYIMVLTPFEKVKVHM